MGVPTAEDDCWVRYRRGDHWSSASWRKWCWVVHTKKPPLCKGRWPKGPEGLYLPISRNNYVQPLSLTCVRQLFEPGRRQSLLTLWLKICHWHIFLTRRAPYTGEPLPPTKKAPVLQQVLFCGIRRRPTFPGRVQPSIIGAEGLNFCVRDGNRWNPFAITTGN